MRAMLYALVTSLLLLAPVLQAEPVGELDFIQRYPLATLVRLVQDEADDHLFALGPYRRSGGEWRPEHSERLAGERRRATYRMPEGRSPETAQEHWLQAMRPYTVRVLYSCRGRACGSSHHWANGVFGIHELYGPDQNQYYDALELQRDGRTYAAAIYSIQRGNRRVYSQIDLVAIDPAAGVVLRVTPDGLLSQLQGQGRAVLEVLERPDATPDPEQIDTLAQALRRDVRLSLRVVGYAHGEGDDATLEARARAHAEAVVAGLRERRVPERRLTIDARRSSEDVRSPLRHDRIELEVP